MVWKTHCGGEHRSGSPLERVAAAATFDCRGYSLAAELPAAHIVASHDESPLKIL